MTHNHVFPEEVLPQKRNPAAINLSPYHLLFYVFQSLMKAYHLAPVMANYLQTANNLLSHYH